MNNEKLDDKINKELRLSNILKNITPTLKSFDSNNKNNIKNKEKIKNNKSFKNI